MAFIKWFKDVSEDDGVELAVLANARFPVPEGFIVTAEACKKAIEQASGNVAQIPKEIQEEIIDSYELLGVRHTTQAEAIMHGTEEVVTVRPSKSRMPVFHVKGGQNVVQAVAACWTSTHLTPVIIHRMISSEKSGTMVTPSAKNEEILIQAAHGLGEAVRGELVKPDSYIVDRSTLAVKGVSLGGQEFMVFRDTKTGKLAKEKLSESDRRLRVLTDKEIYQIARYGKKMSEHYNAPRNIEWAIERDQVHILQCKPLTQKNEEIQNKVIQPEQAKTQQPSREERTTKIRVIVDLPAHAENIAKQTDADGALIRPELIIASGNTHPAHYIHEERSEDYTSHLVNEIKKAATVFKEITLCHSDLRSDEYRNLKGGSKEPYERDPIIGWRGIRRLLDQPKMLHAELKAVKHLHEQGWKNISIMLPFVSSGEEIKKAKELMKKSGIDVPVSAMIETPSSCLTIADICKQGVKTICINIDSLAQLTLGVDKHNNKVQQHFNAMHPTVLSLMTTAIRGCKEHGVEVSACGDISPEMAVFLVRQDIDCIDVEPNAVQRIRQTVEKRSV